MRPVFRNVLRGEPDEPKWNRCGRLPNPPEPYLWNVAAGAGAGCQTQYASMAEPETIFMIPVFHWSDGTPAPHQESH